MLRWQRTPLQLGRRALLVGRAHVGPYDTATFNAGVALDVHACAGLRRGRHVHTMSHPVEFHSMVSTADAVFFIAAEIERHPAVRAELADETGLAVGVSKSQKLFSEQLHTYLRPVGLGDF